MYLTTLFYGIQIQKEERIMKKAGILFFISKNPVIDAGFRYFVE
jgi:hypothetical protein